MTREEALQALEEYRVSIDALDLRLLELLNDRTRVVEQIGRVKRAAKSRFLKTSRRITAAR